MTVGELISRIGGFIKKGISKIGTALPDGGAKVIEAVNSKFTAANAAKVAGAVAAANVVDGLVDDIPVANNIYNWWATTMDDIYENTIRKIPVVGDWLRNLSDFVNKLIIPGAQKAIEEHREEKNDEEDNKPNDPKYYENSAISFKKAFVEAPQTGGWKYPGSNLYPQRIAVLHMVLNNFAAPQIEGNRDQMTFEMTTVLRNLRPTQYDYSADDITYYRQAGYYFVNEYCRLKQAIKLAYSKDVNNIGIVPEAMLDVHGWDHDDFIAHRVLYQDLLVTMYQFIQQQAKIFGVEISRLLDYWNLLIPDFNDGKSQTRYYTYDILATCFIPDAATGKDQFYGPFFKAEGDPIDSSSEITTGTTIYNNDDWETDSFYNHYVDPAGLETYSNYLSKFNAFQRAWKKATKGEWKTLVNDLMSVFGVQCIFSDTELKQTVESDPDAVEIDYKLTIPTFEQSKLLLQAIRNYTDLNSSNNSEYYTPTLVVNYARGAKTSNGRKEPKRATSGNAKPGTNVNSNFDLDKFGIVSFLVDSDTGDYSDNDNYLLPYTDGALPFEFKFGVGSTGSVATHNVPKENIDHAVLFMVDDTSDLDRSTGETLEIASGKSICVSRTYTISGSSEEGYKLSTKHSYVTNQYFLACIQVIDSDAELSYCDYIPASCVKFANIGTALIDARNFSHFPGIYVTYDATNLLPACDCDVIASITDYYFGSYIEASVDSLNAANLTLSDNAKKINNTIDVYNAMNKR